MNILFLKNTDYTRAIIAAVRSLEDETVIVIGDSSNYPTPRMIPVLGLTEIEIPIIEIRKTKSDFYFEERNNQPWKKNNRPKY